ncbi:MAG: tetratricopeptide repeat protein [Deltaproteobacteria bacterium]|nr:tetratricopeptide repeat protein [Deltaproteobacteria bacterium]
MGIFTDKPAGFYARKKNLFIILALFIIGFAIYSNVLLAPFIYDDEMYVLNNVNLRALGNFLAVPWNRYLTYLTFALNYAIGGYNSFDFHLTNIIIHVLNSIWLYYLVLTTLKTPIVKRGFDGKSLPAWTIAFAASLLFLAHPVQTQAVSYVTQRFASLAAFFYLSSVLCYARYRITLCEDEIGKGGMVFYVSSLVLGALSQLSKEISFTLPVMIILYEFLFFEGEGTSLGQRLKRLTPFLFLFLIIPFTFFSGFSEGAGAGVTANIRKGQIMEFAAFSKYEYLVGQFRVIVTYLRLFVWPTGLRLIYDYPMYHSFFEPAVLVSFALISTLLGLSVYLYAAARKSADGARMLFSFGIFWFFMTLSVETSVIPIKDAIFEHRVYLPNAGLSVLASAAAHYLAVTYLPRPASSRVFAVAVITAVTALSVATYRRNIVWGDRLLFWKDNYEKTPNSISVMHDLGLAYHLNGEDELSVEYFKRVLKVEPDNIFVHYNIVGALLGLKKLDEAEFYAKRSVFFMSGDVVPHINLGLIASERGDFKKAVEEYRRAVEISPQYLLPRYNLAIAYYKMNDYDAAIEQYRILLKLDPIQPDVHFGLGEALLKKGRNYEAAARFKEALRLAPGNRRAMEYLDRIPDV